MITPMQKTIESCLTQLGHQGVRSVRITGTDQTMTIQQAITLVQRNGTATAPAYMTEPDQQSQGWFRLVNKILPREIILVIPGQIFEVQGSTFIGRFCYGNE